MRSCRAVLACLLSIAAAACGGGGGNPGDCFGSSEVCAGVTPIGPTPVAGSPNGMYKGTASDGSAVTALVFGESEYWFLYGTATEKRGLWQGTAAFSNGSFTSGDLRQVDVSAAGAAGGTASGTYAPRTSLAATLVGLGTSTLTASYDPGGENAASVAAAVGAYAGGAVSGGNLQTVTLSVAASGAVNGTMQFGCSFSGTLLPEATIDAFRLGLSFTGAQCPTGIASASGIAFVDVGRLYIAVMNAGRTNAFIVSSGRVS